MPRRTRTAKKLAQRIDLSYFRRLPPFRRRLWLLSLGVPSLALLWLAWQGLVGDQEVYSSGPVSAAHAVMGEQCGVCHVARAGVFGREVNDQACLACHDGPLHNAKQSFTPRCALCHVEHLGSRRLAHTSDRACTQCHARLQTKNGPTEFDTAIYGFNDRHPEFAALRSGRSDPGTLKLNHEVHLKPDLRGPEGPVQMECADCHRPPAVYEPWPYGEVEFRPVRALQNKDPLAAVLPSAYMAPIAYAKQCAACHPLRFDERFPEPVPHKEPEIIRAFVVKKFREYIARHPAELGRASRPRRRLPGDPLPKLPRARTPEQWVAERVAEAERLLWHKACKECHSLSYPAGQVPQVAKPVMAVRWLPHAVFDHEPHRMLACTACHAAAPTSRDTQDVLLPSIQTCRQCHRPGKGAEARCFECHRYHDWSQRKRVKGKFTLPELLRGAKVERGPGAAPVQ